MFEIIQQCVGTISGWMYSYILIVMLVGAGLYFTIRTGLMQLSLFGESIRVLKAPKSEREQVSSFEALMVSTASRVGTGNIIGVSVAIVSGGAGAMFWMWLIAILGGASAFVESTLAQIYKRRSKSGSYYGGPSYYIEQALGSRALGVVFSILLIATYAVGFNLLASYNVSNAFSFGDVSVEPLHVGIVLAVLSAFILFSGNRGIIRAASLLVPVMAVVYIIMSFAVIIANIGSLPSVIGAIFKQAFDIEAIFGGFMGSCVMLGVKRGLYSNEAGVGSSPNAAASAEVKHPVEQGLVQMLSVFIDTLLLCSATGLMILLSGVGLEPEMAGIKAVHAAASTILGEAGPYVTTAALVLFGFTTLLGNLYYVEANLDYIKKGFMHTPVLVNIYKALAVAVILVGSVSNIGFAWDLADVTMGFMVIVNIPVIVMLGGTAIRALDDYRAKRREGRDMTFKASDIGIKDVECWK